MKCCEWAYFSDMKVLFVNSCLSDGGSERVMTLLANEFVKRGFETYMVLVRDNKEKNYYLDNQVKLRELKYGKCSKAIKFLKRIHLLRTYFMEVTPDVIISFTLDINVATLIAGAALPSRIIVSERNYPNAKEKNSFRMVLRWIGQEQLYKKAYKVVLQTEQVKSFFNDEVIKKSVVIPNPINPKIPEVYTGERSKKIVAVGRFCEQKNFELLINAFAKFHEVYKDYKLVIYGDGLLRTEYELLLEKLKIGEYVALPGYVADVNDRMRDAAIYVSSSNYEGISNTMLEALALGIPCICTDCPVGGASMAIENGVNGILVPVGDENSLIDALIRVVEDADFANMLSKRAYLIRDTVSVEKIVDKWIEIL